ncbi:hypothetical protein PGQ11_008919 [Apiospora arundinis]|uniref:Cyanovirin-N domain-containing protein n=1 Tax=Apiospora arundinis TaxID=335852 RepID=A0ABR2IGQ3_9PEZI
MALNFFSFLFFAALVSAGYLEYCDDFALVPSTKSADTLFLMGQCLGVYGNTKQYQCSYLDLNQCYVLGAKDKKYHPQRLGNGMDADHVHSCRLTYKDDDHRRANRATGMDCSKPGDLGGTYTADFREIIGADIGFLTCYNRSGFLCPENGQGAPY